MSKKPEVDKNALIAFCKDAGITNVNGKMTVNEIVTVMNGFQFFEKDLEDADKKLLNTIGVSFTSDDATELPETEETIKQPEIITNLVKEITGFVTSKPVIYASPDACRIVFPSGISVQKKIPASKKVIIQVFVED
jgi:hypothetical protein